MVTVVSVLSVVAAIFCMVFLSQGSFSMIGYFIDLPGLIFLALLVIPAVCISGFAKDFGKRACNLYAQEFGSYIITAE